MTHHPEKLKKEKTPQKQQQLITDFSKQPYPVNSVRKIELDRKVTCQSF